MIQGNLLIPTKDERRLLTVAEAIDLYQTFPPRTVKSNHSVCICGCAPSSRLLAEEMPPEVEVWTLNEAFFFMRRGFDRYFNIHPKGELDKIMPWLEGVKVPSYLIEPLPNVPLSTEYPISTVHKPYRQFLTSSIAEMLAMAIQEKYNPIYIVGVDMDKGSEYMTQNAGMAYWIGIADGAGIEIILPQGCPLVKGPLYGYEGYDHMPREAVLQYFAEIKHLYMEARVDARGLEAYCNGVRDSGITGEALEFASVKAHEALMKLNAAGGAAQAIEHLITRFGPESVAGEGISDKLDDGYRDIHG